MKLQECLHNFCSEEELTGFDRYKCEKCDALHECTKSIRIVELPEVRIRENALDPGPITVIMGFWEV